MAKGIAIILMVLVHTCFSDYGGKLINMFHMPLFFLMSGYCFKDTYLDSFKNYAWKRIKGSYWPFVKWGLLFLALHNVFFTLNIYNAEYGYQGNVSNLYTSHDFLQRTIYIVVGMQGNEQLLGGYWFLHSYFIASFITFGIVWLCRKKWQLAVGGGILLIVSVLMTKFNLRVPFYVYDKDVLGASFMVMGYCYKQAGLKWENHIIPVMIIGVCLLVLGTAYWQCSMVGLVWTKTIPYTITAIAGTLMIFSLCKRLANLSFFQKSLSYIGDRTLSILTWHFLSFKIVSLVIIGIYGITITRLAEFPVIQEYSIKGWWILYITIGVTIPLLLEGLSSSFLIHLSKKQRT